jgi:antitoxin CptB
MSPERDGPTELQRLRWQCRRGMLELDVLLDRFLEVGYGQLSDGERAAFSRLLDCEDQLIHDWVMGKSEPAEDDLKRVVARLRQTRW